MKKIMRGCWQVIIDTVVGLATYYILNMFTNLNEKNYTLLITLIVTAIFAEIWEVKKK